MLDLDATVAGAEVRARTGVLTETPSLDERLTARENLTFYAELYRVEASRVRSRVDKLLGGEVDDALLLPAGTRLVHIGPHKTGTSSVQDAFHRARRAAAKHGLHYAGRTVNH